MQQSIRRILNSRIALVIICVNVCISTIFFAFSVRLADTEFHKNIQLQSKHLGDTFAQQLWLFDLNATEQLSLLAIDSPEIIGLRLFDHKKNLLVEKGSFNDASVVQIRKELHYEAETLVGFLELAFINTSWVKERAILVQITLFMVVATVLVTFLLINMLLKRHLVRPLKNLQQDMNNLADGQFGQSDLQGQKREIQSIIDVFNKMATALAQREEERQKAEQKSQESQQRYLSLFRDSKDSIFTATRAGFFADVNPAMLDLLGYSEAEIATLNTQAIFEVKEDQASLQDAIEQQGSINDYRVNLLSASGKVINCLLSASLWASDTGEVLGYQGIVRDITAQLLAEADRQKLEFELRQKYKMEAVGLMAGGMAHNFNNNLAIILGNLELVKRKPSLDEKASKHVDDALIAVLRSRDLIHQIMAYGRQDAQGQSPVEVRLIVEETIKLMRSTIPATVNLVSQIPAEIEKVCIYADPTQIQEALINICNNAVQAMDENGELGISLTCAYLQQADIPAQFKCSAGTYVCLRVRDSGCGMAPEMTEKIFDPFFTTKDIGQGTGMGLSTVRGIVKQHNGLVRLQSTPGQGTTFELCFPVVNQPQELDSPGGEAELSRGSEHILLVDDDEMLTSLGDKMLSEMGYRVWTETDSVKALDIFQQNPAQFDLLITDQTMPGMTGLELTQQIHAVRSELPIILCTGYSTKVSKEEAERLGVSAFCMKPLEFAKLLQTVREVLTE